VRQVETGKDAGEKGAAVAEAGIVGWFTAADVSGSNKRIGASLSS